MIEYYISVGKENWVATAAKTVNGAKALCSKTYQSAVGGVMHVGLKMGRGDAARIERVAIKEGFSAWRSY